MAKLLNYIILEPCSQLEVPDQRQQEPENSPTTRFLNSDRTFATA
jgi:hypothetical protein